MLPISAILDILALLTVTASHCLTRLARLTCPTRLSGTQVARPARDGHHAAGIVKRALNYWCFANSKTVFRRMRVEPQVRGRNVGCAKGGRRVRLAQWSIVKRALNYWCFANSKTVFRRMRVEPQVRGLSGVVWGRGAGCRVYVRGCRKTGAQLLVLCHLQNGMRRVWVVG